VPGTKPSAPVAKTPVPPPTPGAKPSAPAAKPADGAKPAAPAAKAPTPGTKPTVPAAKPAANADKPAPKKVAAKTRSWGASNDGGGRRKIGQIFIDLGFIDEAQLMDLLEDARSKGIRVGQAGIERNLLTDEQVLQAVAEQNSMRIVNLDDAKPTPAALKIIPQNLAELYKVMPLSFENGVLTVAMSDPANLPALDDIRNFVTEITTIQAQLCTPKQLEESTGKLYSGTQEESITDLIAQLEADSSSKYKGSREKSIDISGDEELHSAAPVRKLINMLLLMAIKDQASDIHFEPFEDEYKVRMRCDGVLYEMIPPPRHLANAMSSRIKVMANLDIAERRMPQDGRIELSIGGNPVDMRVSILPTMFGESVVIRVLDRSRVGLDLDRIGMESDILVPFRKLIHKPNGILLVTGPTGSGKTTTLYSALAELNTIDEKLITTEDPVEYEIEGIIQVPINHEIDLTFASALRAILRQDPDRILVGEIRDLETASIAIQAALTGHMVFSTLHTNDAPSTITRLRDMGVEPFLITATVEGILAQRLVRKICTNCRKEFTPSQTQLMELNLRPEDAKGKKFFYGEGCNTCNNMGYKGRQGIHELIVMDDTLRDMVSGGSSTDQLRQFIRSRGVGGLRESGMRALHNGITTIDEVVRETVMEDGE
jgi:type IV pilus assembly protein PilB